MPESETGKQQRAVLYGNAFRRWWNSTFASGNWATVVKGMHRETQPVARMQPLSMVEDVTLNALLAYLEPDYNMPCWKMPCWRSCTMITTSCWTSMTTLSYITAMSHHIDEKWDRKSHELTTENMEERHTEESNTCIIAEWVVAAIMWAPSGSHDRDRWNCIAT